MPTPTSIARIGSPWNHAPATTPIPTVYSDHVRAPALTDRVRQLVASERSRSGDAQNQHEVRVTGRHRDSGQRDDRGLARYRREQPVERDQGEHEDVGQR